MEIRILGPGDEAVLRRAVELADEGPLTLARAKAHLADLDLVGIAAIEQGAVVGFLYAHVLRRFEATSLFIYSVDVVESHRRRGVARAMIEALRSVGRTGRWDEMFVLTNASNPGAMALYASAGGISPPPGDVVMFDFEG